MNRPVNHDARRDMAFPDPALQQFRKIAALGQDSTPKGEVAWISH